MTKDEEKALCSSVGRIAEGAAELLRAAEDAKADRTEMRTTLQAMQAEQLRQGVIVATYADAMKAEQTEVARLRAEKIAGRSALLGLLADPRVVALAAAVIGGVCAILLSYFGVLPHAN